MRFLYPLYSPYLVSLTTNYACERHILFWIYQDAANCTWPSYSLNAICTKLSFRCSPLGTLYDRHRKFWYLSQRRSTNFHMNLLICPVLSEPLLLGCTKYVSRGRLGHRWSYMSAHRLLNLLNSWWKKDKMLDELWKRDKMRGLLSILSLFRHEFNKFNNTRTRTLDSIYHMTLGLLWSLISDVKTL